MCLNEMDLRVLNDDQWICSCLWQNKLHDPICDRWNKCIAAKEALYHDDVQGLKDFVAVVTNYTVNDVHPTKSTTLPQSKENDPPLCIDPLAVNPMALTCDCLAHVRATCPFSQSEDFGEQAESIECLRLELCRHQAVCPSWKSTRCTAEERTKAATTKKAVTATNATNTTTKAALMEASVSGPVIGSMSREMLRKMENEYTDNPEISAAMQKSGLSPNAYFARMLNHQQAKQGLDSSLSAKCT